MNDFLDSIKGGDFNKFVVLKIKDIVKYLPEHDKIDLRHIEKQIADGRKKEGKKQNKYLVINVDEEYSNEIVEILKNNGHWG